MKYSFTSRVRFSEIDANGDLTLYGIINYLQDVSTFHGQDNGIGVDWTMKEQKAWVITSSQLHIMEYPHFGDEIRLSTWATGFRGMIGYREFSITSADGSKTYVLGKSDWVFFDLRRRLPLHADEEQVNRYGIYPELKIEEDLGKRKIKLPKEGGVIGDVQTVQPYQLDTNGHVNNGQWVNMALLRVPEIQRVEHLRVEFKRQAYLGDEITPVVYRTDDGCIVVLNGADGDADCVVELR